ncbi:SUKH-4 family immunity protein [Kitasatospora sp. NPDC001540]|uniref:SUKH-4 family immunity protein n=1 Tax=Kitasatospora sp. NPDC001540 TaxID=3364014 RepID=UPI003693F48A
MTELFGAGGIVSVPRSDADANGVPDEAARVLAEVGLPAEVGAVFSLAVPGRPKAFTLVPVDVGDRTVNVLCLGGPTDSDDMRYCLDLEDGYVILLDLGDEPGAEIVNTTLAEFVEFLYRFGLRMKHTAGSTDRQSDDYTEQLRTYLEARDPLAFSEEDNWWSMVFDRLLGKEF